MPLPSSGRISADMIRTEFKRSGFRTAIGDFTRGGAYVPNITTNSNIKTVQAEMKWSNYYNSSAADSAPISGREVLFTWNGINGSQQKWYDYTGTQIGATGGTGGYGSAPGTNRYIALPLTMFANAFGGQSPLRVDLYAVTDHPMEPVALYSSYCNAGTKTTGTINVTLGVKPAFAVSNGFINSDGYWFWTNRNGCGGGTTTVYITKGYFV